MNRSLNMPFADEATVQAMRALMAPKQRAEFDKLRAHNERGPKGLARLNPQPPKPKPTLKELAPALADAIDAMEAEQLETLHVQEGSADAVVDVLLHETATGEGMPEPAENDLAPIIDAIIEEGYTVTSMTEAA